MLAEFATEFLLSGKESKSYYLSELCFSTKAQKSQDDVTIFPQMLSARKFRFVVDAKWSYGVIAVILSFFFLRTLTTYLR